MEHALFAVPLADLEYGDREIDEEIPIAWLSSALEGTEATPRGQPGHLELTVSKSGREVMVRGEARAAVTMPCARTLDPVPYDLRSEVFLLLAPKAAAPVAHKAPHGAHKKQRSRAGSAPGPARREREEAARLTDEDAAHDTFEGDKVVLDRFVREFLLLELPMVPLREDLRSEATPAIERPPEAAHAPPARGDAIDPRLAPLAAIASRLRDKKE
jgi:uncharacterized metal-binding protein YceD (DUF177 family)